MFIDENLQARGKLKITKIKADGAKEVSMHRNLIVQVGLEYIAQRMVDTGGDIPAGNHVIPAQMSHMQIGDSNTAPAANQTQLLDSTPASGARQPFTSVNVTADNITYEATFTPGQGTAVLVEAGIFNSASVSTGAMLCRTTFPIVTKEADDTIIIQWTVTIAATV
jgi:hypothetical protein